MATFIAARFLGLRVLSETSASACRSPVAMSAARADFRGIAVERGLRADLQPGSQRALLPRTMQRVGSFVKGEAGTPQHRAELPRRAVWYGRIRVLGCGDAP